MRYHQISEHEIDDSACVCGYFAVAQVTKLFVSCVNSGYIPIDAANQTVCVAGLQPMKWLLFFEKYVFDCGA